MKRAMDILIDFRLLDVSLELFALEDHLEIIENQINRLSDSALIELEEYKLNGNLTPEDADWDQARLECDQRIECLFPRIFRGTFLVALYAVFETAVIEIAGLIQKAQKQEITLNDLRGDFLNKANKYYKNILRFELYRDNKAWQRIRMLAELRNAIAHANGRLDMVKKESQKKFKNWEKQAVGIHSYDNYLLVDSDFAKVTFNMVRQFLNDLVERYKEWDTKTLSNN